MNKRILQCFADTEGLFTMGPQRLLSGNICPFNIDNVKVFSDPQKLSIIGEELAKIVNKLDIELLVGIPLAAIPLVTITSQYTKLPFVYIRKEADRRTSEVIQGQYKKGQKAVLIDDVIGAGGTKLKVLKNIGKRLKIKDIVVIWTVGPEYQPNWRDWVPQRGLRIHSFFTWLELVRYLKKQKKMPKEAANIMIKYLLNPKIWQQDKNYKKNFLRYKKRTGLKYGEPLI